ARFAWGLGPAGAEPIVEGFDVVVLDGDDRIATVLGFLDKVPS
ncbi:MAG: nuclear transport factor 2 family protein, partial [Jatrophihabitantaceae bacterium]